MSRPSRPQQEWERRTPGELGVRPQLVRDRLAPHAGLQKVALQLDAKDSGASMSPRALAWAGVTNATVMLCCLQAVGESSCPLEAVNTVQLSALSQAARGSQLPPRPALSEEPGTCLLECSFQPQELQKLGTSASGQFPLAACCLDILPASLGLHPPWPLLPHSGMSPEA